MAITIATIVMTTTMAGTADAIGSRCRLDTVTESAGGYSAGAFSVTKQ